MRAEVASTIWLMSILFIAGLGFGIITTACTVVIIKDSTPCKVCGNTICK